MISHLLKSHLQKTAAAKVRTRTSIVNNLCRSIHGDPEPKFYEVLLFPWLILLLNTVLPNGLMVLMSEIDIKIGLYEALLGA